ncbi:hypothetical protein TNCV_4668571 [Trichonephila clavipes]|nr:hypothetical protein TNCV_4668571 [Trichonephila clavipes]
MGTSVLESMFRSGAIPSLLDPQASLRASVRYRTICAPFEIHVYLKEHANMFHTTVLGRITASIGAAISETLRN